jgi:hypothetical protein
MPKRPKPPTYVKKAQCPKKKKGMLCPKAFAKSKAYM